jgi:hypothetical protein
MCSFCVKISENLDQELLIRTEKTKVRRNAEYSYMAQNEDKSAMKKYGLKKRVVKEWM